MPQNLRPAKTCGPAVLYLQRRRSAARLWQHGLRRSLRSARSLEHHMTSGVTETPGRPPADGELAWHTLGADQVLHSEGVDGQRGLSAAEAAARAERFGPNKFAAGQAESR